MSTLLSCPIICTDKFAQTVDFYEDHMGFTLAVETDGYALMKREGREGVWLSVIDRSCQCKQETCKDDRADIVLSYPVKDVGQVYEKFYWDGLTLGDEPDGTDAGDAHFTVEDPNGILINVSQDNLK